MKLIRECRMGQPKSFKTGAVVGTYPKPMLVLSFDEGGLDIIPNRGKESTLPGSIKFDVTAEDIVTIKPSERAAYFTKPMEQQPKVLCLNMSDPTAKSMDLTYKAIANSAPMGAVVDVLNELGRMPKLPWRTIVFDPVTEYQNLILSHISQTSSASLNDARAWASMIGAKVAQTVGALTSLQCHVVVIIHSQIDKNELTGAIVEQPNIYGRIRDSFGGLFSQFFYSAKLNGKPVIWTTDQGFVRGIGPRWPAGLAPQVEPDFHAIYGKEGLT